MDSFVRAFIRASLIWLGAGVLIGLAMAIRPDVGAAYRPAHMHANMLGFVSMMIFGVAYHVIPRFTGNPLWSPSLARAHLWVANLGLTGMVVGWMIRPTSWDTGSLALIAGGILSAAGACFFIVNQWKTLEDRRPAIVASPLVALTRSHPVDRAG
jgi:heme/copper-type cytochrome/quinol oxidase subunit 1